MQFVVNYADRESLIRRVIMEFGISELYDTAHQMIDEIAGGGGEGDQELYNELILESLWGTPQSLRKVAVIANGFAAPPISTLSHEYMDCLMFRLEDAERVLETEKRLREIVNGKGENANG